MTASDSGSLAEVLASARILVPEVDSDATASALEDLIDNRTALADLRRQAPDRAAGELSWDAGAAQMDAMVRQSVCGV